MKNSKELTRDRQNKFQIYLGEKEVDLLREKAKKLWDDTFRIFKKPNRIWKCKGTVKTFRFPIPRFAERTKPHRGEHQSYCPESK